jgi:hypothetical protein
MVIELNEKSQEEIESRLRNELKMLLGSPQFRDIKDLDEMTDILMLKLA